MRVSSLCAVLGLCAALSVGCKPPPSNAVSSSAPAPSASAEDEARQIFAARCSPCHGAEGTGNGAAAAALTPRPRNFHDAAWQTAITDAQIEDIIRRGGAAVGKSPLMPPNPDLTDKPAVVAALRATIRGMH